MVDSKPHRTPMIPEQPPSVTAPSCPKGTPGFSAHLFAPTQSLASLLALLAAGYLTGCIESREFADKDGDAAVSDNSSSPSDSDDATEDASADTTEDEANEDSDEPASPELEEHDAGGAEDADAIGETEPEEDSTSATCGDGVQDPGEDCDDGDNNGTGQRGACNTNCTVNECTDEEERSCAEAGLLGWCGEDGVQICKSGEWGDCSVLPAGVDTCELNGDANCDGIWDAECECTPGTTRSCAADGELGNCAAGVQTCDESGHYSDCGIQPSETDSCSVPGDDADCNGSPNSGCSCEDGDTQPCGPSSDEGICKLGTSTCVDGAWSACDDAIFPEPRDCSSSEDNDCDGLPDNTVDEVCGCQEGAEKNCEEHPGLDGNGQCTAGTQSCVLSRDGQSSDWGSCLGSVGPAGSDSCSALEDDSDCDGIPNGGCDCIAAQISTCGAEYGSLGDCASKQVVCSLSGTWQDAATACQPEDGEFCEGGCRPGVWDEDGVLFDNEVCWQ